MALIALASANGSPGVTTTALGLALTWPRPCVLVDADPTGASAIPAGYFRGGQLPKSETVVDLAIAHRQGHLAEALPHMLMPMPNSQVLYLAGPRSHVQANSLRTLWQPLGTVLRALERNGQDVIIDAGRLGLDGSPLKLFTNADLALLVTRSTLPALVAAATWAETLTHVFEQSGAQSSLAAAVIGAGMPFRPATVKKTIGLPVAFSISWDPKSAEVFSLGADAPRKFDHSDLIKSLRTAAHSVRSRLQADQAALGTLQQGPEDGSDDGSTQGGSAA